MGSFPTAPSGASDKDGCNAGQSALSSGIDFLTTAGTYYPILGATYSAEPSYGFDVSTDSKIIRTCPGSTRTVHLSGTLSGFVGNATDAYRVAWLKNGASVGAPSYVQAVGSFVQAVAFCAVSCEQGDEFQLAITNATGHNSDTFVLMSLSTKANLVKTA